MPRARTRAPASPPGHEALATYAKKRDFSKTPEPSGAAKTRAKKSKDLRFVVQMHRASRLHYDFRLEAGGVLKSWAIPKGPTFDTREKRFAAHVEDHPLDYREFEGIIPKGNYGAGEVIVWDAGTYRLLEGDDTTAQIAKGSVKFELFGKKLHGGFALVRMKPRDGEEDAWLLIKERDEFVDPAWRIEDHSESVKTGMTVAEIANDPSAPHWISNRPEKPATGRAARKPAHEPMPEIASPMLATAVDAAFDDPKWLFELKWDGYRALTRIEADGSVTIASRNGNDFTTKFPELASLAQSFSERPLIVDGELVVLDAQGRPSFSALQERLDRFGRNAPEKNPVTYVVFDLLYGNGRDLRGEPLAERKAALEGVLTGRGPVMLSKHVVGMGRDLYALAAESGLEGIIGKRAASTYLSRRTRDWVKVKALHREEIVIGGWTEPRKSRKHFGALLMGVHEEGALRYVGSVGTGFDDKALAAIAKRLAAIERTSSPFDPVPKTETKAHWVEPTLVAEVSYAEWTRDGSMRHPVFVAMRSDKDSIAVERERPEPAPKPAKTQVPAVTKIQTPPANKTGRGSKEPIEIDGHALAITNRDKVLWPSDGYTKGDLIAYYRAVAPYLLPHLRGRPLTLERYPDGIAGESFFEKHAPKYLPNWIERVVVPHGSGNKSGPIDFIVCNDEATLAYVANLAAIVLHVWTSRKDAIDEPDLLFFDLDPFDGCTLANLAKTALALRDVLAEVGLAPLIKSSGGSGLHVVVPLTAGHSYEFCKGFGELVARTLHARLPAQTTLERMPAKRPAGTVYLDYVQIGRGKTMVSAFSARPRDGAPVSMPLDWSEIEAMARKRARETEGEFARFTIKNAPALLASRGDLWGKQFWKEQKLEAALRKAQRVWI
jgi:bifunctional non-homologous end joining protein LigD